MVPVKADHFPFPSGNDLPVGIFPEIPYQETIHSGQTAISLFSEKHALQKVLKDVFSLPVSCRFTLIGRYFAGFVEMRSRF